MATVNVGVRVTWAAGRVAVRFRVRGMLLVMVGSGPSTVNGTTLAIVEISVTVACKKISPSLIEMSPELIVSVNIPSTSSVMVKSGSLRVMKLVPKEAWKVVVVR